MDKKIKILNTIVKEVPVIHSEVLNSAKYQIVGGFLMKTVLFSTDQGVVARRGVGPDEGIVDRGCNLTYLEAIIAFEETPISRESFKENWVREEQ